MPAPNHSRRLMQLLADNAGSGAGLRSSIRNDAATLYLYDVIDPYFGVSAMEFAAALMPLRNAERITLRINSPGGDVFEGRTIASLLSDFADRLTVQVDGLAASAATTVALAGGTLRMAPGSMFMVHNAWTYCVGNKNDLLARASLLEKVDNELIAEYASKSGQTVETVAAWMNAETWMTADETVANGFADSVGTTDEDPATEPGLADRCGWNLAAYAQPPAELVNRYRKAPKTDDAQSADTRLRDAASRTLRLRTLSNP
jgi:ATP-dependent Clp protease protease subunit